MTSADAQTRAGEKLNELTQGCSKPWRSSPSRFPGWDTRTSWEKKPEAMGVARKSEAQDPVESRLDSDREQAAEPRGSAQMLLNPRCRDEIDREEQA